MHNCQKSWYERNPGFCGSIRVPFLSLRSRLLAEQSDIQLSEPEENAPFIVRSKIDINPPKELEQEMKFNNATITDLGYTPEPAFDLSVVPVRDSM